MSSSWKSSWKIAILPFCSTISLPGLKKEVQATEFKLPIIFKWWFSALYSTSQFLFHILLPKVVIPIPFSALGRVVADPWDACQIWFTTFYMLQQNSAEAQMDQNTPYICEEIKLLFVSVFVNCLIISIAKLSLRAWNSLVNRRMLQQHLLCKEFIIASNQR